ncbi:MAG: DUF6465 family protein [Candidatus Weimeria sp.]
MALKTKKSADADIATTVRDILNAGKEDSKKVAEEVKKETEKVKMATTKAVAETKAKVEEKKSETAAKKEAAPKKTAARTTAATTKTAAKKASATVKKATTAVKKAVEAKTQEPKVIVQFAGNDYKLDEILEKAKKAYSKKSKKVFKDLRVYIKPEEGKAYYVADDNFGSIDL